MTCVALGLTFRDTVLLAKRLLHRAVHILQADTARMEQEIAKIKVSLIVTAALLLVPRYPVCENLTGFPLLIQVSIVTVG